MTKILNARTVKAVLTAVCLVACAPAFTAAQQRGGGRGGSADAAAAAAFQGRQTTSPNGMGLQGYSVVLVVGDMQGSGPGDTVPSAARKALTDMQAFLPYKRYQLLDAAWMLCCASFRAATTGRLKGPDDREYSYSIDTIGSDNAKLTVRFSMRDTDTASVATPAETSGGRGGRGAPAPAFSAAPMSDTARAEYSRQLYEAQKERDDAEIQLRRARQMREAGTMPGSDYEAVQRRYERTQQRVAELQRTMSLTPQHPESIAAGRGSMGRSLMDSTFSIAVGETVVIGTSRLKGDQALIALLTAAGKPVSSR